MVIQIPVAFQPVVGQVQEFRIKGLVKAVEANSELPGQWTATIEITDPLMAAQPDGMPDHYKDRRINIRAEMRGGTS